MAVRHIVHYGGSILREKCKNVFPDEDLSNLINIGAYNFYPMTPRKDKSIYHTNPEEALNVAQDLKSKKVIGMHWGTFVLSLEPIMEPRVSF